MTVELSNWNRWGKDDQMGTVNLITAAKRVEAHRLVREGHAVSLWREIGRNQAPGEDQPYELTVFHSGDGNVDRFTIGQHGHEVTHMDALSHWIFQGKLYNGVPEEVVTPKGTGRLSISVYRDGVVSRGLLMDAPRLKGLPYLDPAAVIYPQDLDLWEKKTGLKAGPGDILFVRTGHWALQKEKGPWGYSPLPGLHVSCARWLKQRDIAVLATDAIADAQPSGVEGAVYPLHQVLIAGMGNPVIDNCDLEALGEAANQRKRWEFHVSILPLALAGATGSPVNPVATF